jgi:hypothetical protein
MEAQKEKPAGRAVQVEFNQQQEVILQQLAAEGKYGKDYAEILRNVFQEFLRQTRL